MFIVVAILFAICVVLFKYLNKDFYILALCKRIKTADGSPLESKINVIPNKTIFGHNFDILNVNSETIFIFLRNNLIYTKGKSYLLYFANAPVYNICTAEETEEVFQSQALISKGVLYDLLRPFLGEGLLMSTDKKWQFRRKILTSAFHFNILQSFLQVFKEESCKFITELGKKSGEIVSLGDIIPAFTLNNVCETALGVKLDDIQGGASYRAAINGIEQAAVKRMCNPLMFSETLFYLFGDYKEHKTSLEIAHNFSSKIIEKRRKDFQQEIFKKDMSNGANTTNDIGETFGKKKRYAMLDTLLDAEANGLIDHQGICDEVNTFMFEGYDTTSICLIFAILNLAVHPDIQEKCYQEIENLPDIDDLTIFDLNKLEYLECVIKETLRLYPSVPFISRRVVTDTEINGLLLPKTTQINIHIYDIMRDAKHFTDPTKFDPERFSSENSLKRYPFAFVPFSAGQRNCIGQKFAILEIKLILTAILKNFKILPITRREDMILVNGIVLRTKYKVQAKFVKRN